MGTEMDRRAQFATRIPFDATVEVGGALGPSFEAHAINLSPDGMQLKTAYLPEVGQPVSCSFEAAELGMILVGGVVIWQEKHGDGGEFGIRFTNIDPESNSHLRKIFAAAPQDNPGAKPGARVRLHIDGLGSPLRARVRDVDGNGMTACSDLNFVKIGKSVDLEDATSGNKRPATIGRVELEVDPETAIPQLVVSMRYSDVDHAMGSHDEAGTTDASNTTHGDHGDAPRAQEPARAIPNDAREIEEESSKMKSAFAKKAQTVGPALNAWAKTTKSKIIALLKKRKNKPEDDVAVPLRRMTSPPPAGALHTSGRKILRADVDGDMLDAPKRGFKFGKRHAAVAGAVGIATVLAIVAFHKPSEKSLATAPVDSAGADTLAQTAPTAPAAPALTQVPAINPAALPVANNSDMSDPGDDNHKGKKSKVVPFSNGPVAHGNVLRLKMDGSIEKIQGAQQPTGFTVVIPNRKSEDAAAPLAARDSRIAGINVANNPNGAELTVAFKDGVPNYTVRARGSYLEIVLAQGAGTASTDQDPDAPKSTAKKSHGKHHHNK